MSRERYTRLATEHLRLADQVERERAAEVAPLLRAGLLRDAARYAVWALKPGVPLVEAYDAVASQLGPGARRTVVDSDAVSDAALSPGDLEIELELRKKTAATLLELAAPREPFPVAKVARFGVIALTAALVAVGGISLARWAGKPADLADGKAWRTSSSAATCHPEKNDCMGVRTPILFHTHEEDSPWFEIDLGAPTKFSGVNVKNRSDGYAERAVPLVIEASDDQQAWRELARREQGFDAWAARFEPTTARWVRMRVPRRTTLHLDGAQVLP